MRIAQPTVVLLLASLAISVSGCSGMRKVGNAALPGQPFGQAVKVVCKQTNKDYVGAKELPPRKGAAVAAMSGAEVRLVRAASPGVNH